MSFRNLVFTLVLFTGCTFTTTKTIEPQFKNGTEALEPAIGSLINFQHINISGIKTTVDGKTERTLDISIINASALPENAADLKELARSIALVCKDQLVNRGEFDIFSLSFITQSDKDQVRSNHFEQVSFTDKELH